MIGNSSQNILVVNDVEATRKSIEMMLTKDGYQIKTAGDEHEAATSAQMNHFDLLLVSLDGETEEVIEKTRFIRRQANLNENIPAIIFCADGSNENEISVEPGIYLSCPENFNRLRDFISRLLKQFQKAKHF